MSTQEIAPTNPNRQKPIDMVCSTIKHADFRANLAQALPPGIDPDRFVRVTLTALQQNPSLANGDRQSLYTAVIRCAQDGLLPDGKRAALVMFGQQVQYMPMIGGLREILANHGIILATGVVHKNDSFEYELGVEPTMQHKPAALDADRGEAIGAWAQAKDADGNIYLEVMGKQDIEVVRQVSRAKNGDLWTKWWGEAARKTVGRRLFKSLPLADKLDERESRILDAMDAEMDFNAPTNSAQASTDQPQNGAQQPPSGPRRPRGLDAVAAAGNGQPAGGDQGVIDGESTRVEDGNPPSGDPEAASAEPEHF